MRRIAFILSIIILAGLAAYLFFFRNNTTLNPFESDFALSDPAKVTKITITDEEGTSSLIKTTQGWKTGGETVFQQKVEDLFLFVSLIETRAPAPIILLDNINTCLDKGAKINFFHNQKVLKSFALCKYHQSIYARKENSRKAFRISIRGYSNTDLTAIITSRLQDWQQNIIIDIGATDIKLVSINYPGNNKKGFTLMVDSTGRTYLFDREGTPIEQTIHHKRVEEYLYSFTDIRFHNAERNSPVDEFIKNVMPFCELKIAARNSTLIAISGYRLTNPETGKSNPLGFYTVHPDFGFVLLKYSDFDPILVEQDYFLKN